MYRHRVSEIFSYRGTYRGLPEAEPQQKIYEEPLYAYANESARVFRPEKVAIIGRSHLEFSSMVYTFSRVTMYTTLIVH